MLFRSSATVIQWHALAMFVPSFFTGDLIRRFGVFTIMRAGAVLMLACVAVNMTGQGFLQFLAPTISFVIGVLEGEAFNTLRLVSFVFIWGGAAVYAYGAWKKARALKARVPLATPEEPLPAR